MSEAAKYEPDPIPGKINVGGIVIKDMQERIDMGYKKYGTYLQTNNGRDSLWDAYQEALDLVMYLRQKILETENQK